MGAGQRGDLVDGQGGDLGRRQGAIWLVFRPGVVPPQGSASFNVTTTVPADQGTDYSPYLDAVTVTTTAPMNAPHTVTLSTSAHGPLIAPPPVP